MPKESEFTEQGGIFEMGTKRFTDAGKWRDKWFRRLRPEHKLLWLYLLDNCDIAGVIDWDVDDAEFSTGLDLASSDHLLESFLEECNSRVQKLRDGKFWVPKFIEFQQHTKQLQLSNNCHYGIVKLLEKYGISPAENGFEVLGLRRAYVGPTKGLRSPIGKGKGKGKGNTMPKTLPFGGSAFEAAWAAWEDHRKEIKKPLTRRAVEMQFKHLAAMGEQRAIRAIEFTIERGWVGIREPKPEDLPDEPRGQPMTSEELREYNERMKQQHRGGGFA